MNSGIYCYENILNGKKYVGQTVNIKRRISNHETNFKRSSPIRENKLLWRAVQKYGRNNFKFYVVEYCNSDRLDELEIYYINFLSSHFKKNGYNVSYGGGTTRGVKATKQARKKMSLSHLGKSHDRGDKISKTNSGKKRKYATSSYKGVHLILRENKRYWVVDVKRKQKRLFNGCFQTEICAAIFYDLGIIENNLNSPLNFTTIQREELLNSSTWKNRKLFGKKRDDSSSKYFGVIKSKIYWIAQIKNEYIGNFKNELDAAVAYNKYVYENNLPYLMNEFEIGENQ